MPEAKDIIRKIVERDGRTLVSFRNHAAYYALPSELRALAAEAKEQGREVAFSFDKDLLITALA